jgi:hypothetical protein
VALRRTLSAAAVLTLGSVAAFVGPGAAQALGQDAYEHVSNARSVWCIAIAGGSSANNAKAVQYACDGHATRVWRLVPSRFANQYYLQNKVDKCLSPAGGSRALRARIVQFTCDSDVARLWSYEDEDNDGWFRLRNSHSSLCLSTDGDSLALNGKLIQYSCDDNWSRYWA